MTPPAKPNPRSTLLIAGRLSLGAALMIAPRTIARPWVTDTDHPTVRYLLRIIGGREVAMAVSLLAVEPAQHTNRKRLLTLDAAFDLWDALIAISARPALPGPRRPLAIAAALSWATLGILTATRIDNDSERRRPATAGAQSRSRSDR
ncbi:hypothetical protein BJY24_005706 [Nocardia transvalensis]|uniref:Uncharacterized protein n=1 Tax=Nocardia transvalensis TaxID=37333 RepID=A0A7W9PIH6_9NOCA|nr:hypothetical protein [Nocardia transvalensis]MBB5916794.1 hypothetical protein [Nocardia transvalensis]